MTKKMKIKYAVCLPLMTLFLVLGALGAKRLIPGYWSIVAIVINGLCIVVRQIKPTFFAPRKQDEQK